MEYAGTILAIVPPWAGCLFCYNIVVRHILFYSNMSYE